MVNKVKFLRRLYLLKLFVAIIFVFSLTATQAQIEFGVRLAPNLSLTEVREASYIKGTFKTTPLPRVSTGLSVDLFSFTPESP